MKKQLLLSLFASLLLSFTAFAQVGFTCDNPIVIGSLPYQTIDDTANYANTITGPQLTSCIAGGVNYQSGNDVFYSFTATENASVSFIMMPTQTRSSLFIYPSCSGITGNCLAAVGNTTNSPRIINYNVVAGTTYTILVSSNAISPTINYTLIIQQEDCLKPTNLGISNISLTSATFSWNNPEGNALSYQVAVQPQGSSVPAGAGQYTGITTSNFTATDLSAGTLYQYWVRSACVTGGFSAWAGPFSFNTQICTSVNQCTYTFRMTDSANNGWNGARMQVRQNGIVLATIGNTYVSGSGPVDIAVPVCKDVPFDIFWSVAGSQPQQCIVSVVNSFGQTIATINGANQQVGSAIFASVINCETPICNIAPTSVQVESITSNGGTIYWTAPATENVGFDIYLVPTGSSAPSMTTTPTYSGMNGNAAPFSYIIPTPNNLLADTFYDVYVRVQCNAPSNSPWSAVKTFKTLATCPKPTNQTVTGITTTSAVLGWTEVATASQWEVLLVAAPNANAPAVPGIIPNIGVNDIYVQNISGATSTSVTLTPATIYYYYVRSVCQPGDDKSTWTGPFIFNTITCNASEKCNYKFLLTNTANNNWNSGRIQVRQYGIVVATLGTSGVNNANGISVALCNNAPFDLFWSAEGTSPATIGLTVINTYDDVLYTKSPGQGTPLTVLFSDNSLGNCTPPTCPKPSNLLAVASQTSVQLGWTETGTATQWEVYVTAEGGPVPVNGTPLNIGITGYYLANTNSNFVINGLLPATKYIYYVRAICSSTDIGTWTVLNAKSFTTKPLNDECSAAFTIPVNPTLVMTQTVSGTTLGGTASAEISTCLGSENDDVWFSFIATHNIHIVKLLNIIGSTTALRFVVYSGADCTTITQVFCSGTNNNTAVLTNLVLGNTYKVRVYTNGINTDQSATFDIGISTTPPSATNDEVNTAIPIGVNILSECVYLTPGNLIGATASTGFPAACVGNENDDVWFSFIANSNHNFITLLDVEGTTTILNHSVFSGSPENLTQLYCSSSNNLSSNNVNYVTGQTYYLRVWSNGSTNEAVIFNICIKPVSNCQTAAPFCGGSDGDIYIFPNATGVPSSGQFACLFTTPNPIYYTLNVSETGPLNFTIYQNTNISPTGQLLGTNLDVDFVAWGPFPSPESCDQIVFGPCSPPCPNNTTSPNFYPLGNVVDCSYSGSFTETISIPDAQAGEYYVILITNFNGNPGFISLLQDNYNEPDAGATSCGDSIQLVSFVDTNNNGQKEDAEAFFTYGSFTAQKNNVGAINYLNNPMGVQNIFDPIATNTYDFNYQIDSEYAAYYALTPTTFNDLNIPFGSGVQTLYFPITVTQTYSDVDVSIIPTGVPRPGFQYLQKIIYRNLGLVSTSGTLNFTKANPNIVITEVLPSGTTITSNGFTFNYTNLAPGEIRFINVKMNVPTLPTVNLGDVATTSVNISSTQNDININNNSFLINQIVVGSYDPNDKNESRGSTINISQFNQDDYLFYTIRFQNEGTASAETVRIEDLLEAEFNLSSIRMISASHHYSMERINNKLVWTFNNINLVPATTSDLLSQGYVTFKIKLNPGFAVNDVIENTAEIYFDFNPAIITNTFQTTFVPNLSTSNFEGNSLVIYPNPTTEQVQVSLQNTTEAISKIVVYDVIGKTVLSLSANNTQQTSINVGSLAKGMYLIEITTDTNLKQVRKFIVK